MIPWTVQNLWPTSGTLTMAEGSGVWMSTSSHAQSMYAVHEWQPGTNQGVLSLIPRPSTCTPTGFWSPAVRKNGGRGLGNLIMWTRVQLTSWIPETKAYSNSDAYARTVLLGLYGHLSIIISSSCLLSIKLISHTHQLHSLVVSAQPCQTSTGAQGSRNLITVIHKSKAS